MSLHDNVLETVSQLGEWLEEALKNAQTADQAAKDTRSRAEQLQFLKLRDEYIGQAQAYGRALAWLRS